MENLDYRNENIERKCLKNMRNNQLLKSFRVRKRFYGIER